MGYALASVFAGLGAAVTLISGPVDQKLEHAGVRIIPVTTAEEMLVAAKEEFPGNKISVFAAAVADFSPENPYREKVKRKEGNLVLSLKPTTDIAAALGKIKQKGQILVGFALETHDEIENARKKLIKKNLDLIVLNSLRDEGAGFLSDTNRVTIMDKRNNIKKYELKTKKEVAMDIIEEIMALL